ncbi:hypothetical protein GA0070214_113166 [Micromonospora chaiyaphumensis]|uniref:Uncharacterized protein n=1 Tax=Micromonospora chaiyaphumensis TaxID=307119 RepID=A0A1C4ZDR9_9ACTN|nr:hypothetical protein GA0070214_113166 [Micromonospora chaiyaphumensis]
MADRRAAARGIGQRLGDFPRAGLRVCECKPDDGVPEPVLDRPVTDPRWRCDGSRCLKTSPQPAHVVSCAAEKASDLHGGHAAGTDLADQSFDLRQGPAVGSEAGRGVRRGGRAGLRSRPPGVGRGLAVAVGTQQSQVGLSVVEPVAVYVVDLEDEGRALPPRAETTDGTLFRHADGGQGAPESEPGCSRRVGRQPDQNLGRWLPRTLHSAAVSLAREVGGVDAEAPQLPADVGVRAAAHRHTQQPQHSRDAPCLRGRGSKGFGGVLVARHVPTVTAAPDRLSRGRDRGAAWRRVRWPSRCRAPARSSRPRRRRRSSGSRR